MEGLGRYFGHNLFWNMALFAILLSMLLRVRLWGGGMDVKKVERLGSASLVASTLLAAAGGAFLITYWRATLARAVVGIDDFLPSALFGYLGGAWLLPSLRRSRGPTPSEKNEPS